MYKDFLDSLSINSQQLTNLVGGAWVDSKVSATLIHPCTGQPLLTYPDTQVDELEPFLNGLKSCPKSGLHNPLKNVDRYLMLGQVSFKAAMMLEDPAVADYFAHLIQSVMPKSLKQCVGEVTVVKQFLKNFGGDQVRFLANGTTSPGDHVGQQPQDYNWPFGPVVIIAPFNFPLEIPALQLMGALYMGNRPLIKSATTVSVVIEQFIELLHHCGLPMTDVDLIHCRGSVMNELLSRGKNDIRLVQFTGSSEVAEKLAVLMHGKVRIEDAGFDWKILGPDFKAKNLDYVAWQCDQDAYAASGQKCSATSILFAHENWVAGGLLEKLAQRAASRNLDDLTIGPVLTWTTDDMLKHVQKILAIPDSRLLFGGNPLKNHIIPLQYGAIQPTAVYVPLEEMMKPEYFSLVTTEIFGPFQIVTSYNDDTLALVLEACERMQNHLTAAVVSDDPVFVNTVLAYTVNGTTYAGIRARTTGAPQNHWFGPSGDPRGAGIGTPKAIIITWSALRCINRDVGPIDYSVELAQS